MSHTQDVLDLAFEVRALVSDLNTALARRLEPLGLTCVQAEALLALAQDENVTLKQLSRRIVAESGHPSRLVSRLVSLGLVTRTRSHDDGRAVLLRLTPAGRRLAYRADETRKPLIEQITSQHGPELTGAVELLRSLRATICAPG